MRTLQTRPKQLVWTLQIAPRALRLLPSGYRNAELCSLSSPVLWSPKSRRANLPLQCELPVRA
eukprot:9574590-Alexandrium_andersonii.AAC.1